MEPNEPPQFIPGTPFPPQWRRGGAYLPPQEISIQDSPAFDISPQARIPNTIPINLHDPTRPLPPPPPLPPPSPASAEPFRDIPNHPTNHPTNSNLPQRPAREERRRIAWALRTAHRWSEQQITDHLNAQGYGPLTVNDTKQLLKRMAQYVAKELKESITEYKVAQLQTYESMLQEALEQYNRSKHRDQVTIQEGRAQVHQGEVIALPPLVTTIPNPDQRGDPQYLTQAHQALKAQRELLGLDEPKKTDVTTQGQAIKAYIGVNVDEV